MPFNYSLVLTLGIILSTELHGSIALAHEGHHKDKQAPLHPSGDLVLPDFSLKDQNGATVNLATLAGKIWIADFIYTTCPDECPLMTSKMRNLQQKLADVKNLAFLSVTTDPKIDTPVVLKNYAKAHKADEKNWLFLTGEKKEIVRLSVSGFKLGADEKSPNHSSHFVLIDGKGNILDYYDSQDPKALTKLQKDARSAGK